MNEDQFLKFLQNVLDKVSDAIVSEQSENVRAICSKTRCQLEEIRETVADDLERQARGEIEERPHDDEEYDTSEEEQSKSHEDEEEILGRRAEADLVLTERYGLDFYDLIDDFEKLSWLPKESAVTILTSLRAKVCGHSPSRSP